MNDPKFVIVAGALAGGMSASSEFVAQLKSGMDASVFVIEQRGNHRFKLNFQAHPVMKFRSDFSKINSLCK